MEIDKIYEQMKPEQRAIYSKMAAGNYDVTASLMWVLFMVVGFPFYAIAIGSCVGHLITGHTVVEALQSTTGYLAILAVEAVALTVIYFVVRQRVGFAVSQQAKVALSEQRARVRKSTLSRNDSIEYAGFHGQTPMSIWSGRIGGILFLLMFAAFGYGFAMQENGNSYLREGRKAYRNHDYKLAEEKFQLAHDLLQTTPFNCVYGPACYRLAEAYEKNGKGLAAIPLYAKAVDNCDWSDDESNVNFRPAVFRSHCAQGRIYAQSGDVENAVKQYKVALLVIEKEQNVPRAKQEMRDFVELLNKKGDVVAARVVEAEVAKYAPEHDSSKPVTD